MNKTLMVDYVVMFVLFKFVSQKWEEFIFECIERKEETILRF